MSKFFPLLIFISIWCSCTKTEVLKFSSLKEYPKGVNLIENPTFDYVSDCCGQLRGWHTGLDKISVGNNFQPILPEDFVMKLENGQDAYYDFTGFVGDFYDFQLKCDVKVMKQDKPAYVGLYRMRIDQSCGTDHNYRPIEQVGKWVRYEYDTKTDPTYETVHLYLAPTDVLRVHLSSGWDGEAMFDNILLVRK
jgi:hypothetical protein